MAEKSKYNFKCLGQECETQACHTRHQVRVTIGDLSRWTSQNQLNYVLGGVGIFPDAEDDKMLTMAMFPKPLKGDPEKKACIFYNEESKSCNIAYFKPISCRTYPLEYDGSKYYVSDKNCLGVGKGEVTKESLKVAKELAEQDYNERMTTRHVLPAFYNVIMNMIALQNQVAMGALSEEDRQALDKIMSKTKSEDIAPETPEMKTGEVSNEETSQSSEESNVNNE
ncbi:MAG: hypothetical protein P1Q69_03065 [Candidatus Thorarchaeota archaeon]|nr:hypothetical protein [Candidatus Thorarchaeota archaeon]